MEELKLTHLSKRSGVYYFRRKIPIELIRLYGKKEIIFSLKSKDRKQAETLARKWGVHYDDEFLMKLSEHSTHNSQIIDNTVQPINISKPSISEGLTIADTDVLAFRYLRGMRERRELLLSDTRALSMYLTSIKGEIEDLSEYLSTGDHPLLDNPTPIWKSEAKLRAAKAFISGESLPNLEAMVIAKPYIKEVSVPSNVIYLTDVVAKWANERKPIVRTVHHTKLIVDWFDRLVGKIAITKIKKTDIVLFKDKLMEEGKSVASINNYIVHIGILLNYAVTQGLIEVNVTKGVSIKDTRLSRELRLPFDIASLNKIFSSTIYTENYRPVGGKGEASYWLPLLALFTGARLNELCQLLVGDIYEEQYQDSNSQLKKAWVINISNEGEGQHLKNKSSKRRIPIHPTLIKLGFIKYVQTIKTGMIFPKLTPDKSFGSISSNWSKWFGTYLRKVLNIRDSRMVFHSFRHTFKDYARNSGISSEIHHAITGHSTGDVGDNYGGIVYPLKPLVEAMEMYQVQGLKL